MFYVTKTQQETDTNSLDWRENEKRIKTSCEEQLPPLPPCRAAPDMSTILYVHY